MENFTSSVVVSKRNCFSLRFFAFLMTFLALTANSAWGATTSTLQLASGVIFGTTSGSTKTTSDGNVTWTATATQGSIQNSFQTAYYGQQFGTGTTAFKGTFTAPAIAGKKITSISIRANAGTTRLYTLSATVGGTAYTYSGGGTSASVTKVSNPGSNTAVPLYTFTGSSTGEIVITVGFSGSAVAFYLNSIAITYEDAIVPPALTTPSPTSLSGFSTTAGSVSVAQSFTIGGSNLTADLVVTAPTDYEVRENGTGTFGSSVSFTPSSGTVASKTIEVRVAASALVGTPSGNVVCSSTGATTQNVAVSGTVNSASAPLITIEGALNAFANTVMNATSAEQSYTVLGANLTDNIIVTPPAGFEISRTTSSGFVVSPGTLTFTPAEALTAQNIYVRFAPTAAQAYSGNIAHTSTGATQMDKAVSGTGVNAEPTNQPTGLTATTNSSSQITITWTDASGAQAPAGYIVKVAVNPSSPTAPVDGTAEADATLVKNIVQGTQQAVFTGLSASTTYNFSIWPYTNSGTTINYKTDGTVATASATTSILLVTAAAVTLRPSHIDLSSTTSESAVLMTLTNYSSNDARFRLYNGSNQYSPWDESTDAYITSSSYGSGPAVPGTPTTSSTFWIVFHRGSNNSATVTYRDRLGTGYSANYQTAVLPDATSISSGFTLSGDFVGTQTYNNSVKHVVLAYSGATLVSASSTTLSTGAFAVVCPTGTTIDKIEIRAIDNTLIVSSTGSWSSNSSIGDLPIQTFTGTGEWTETARWNTGAVPGTTAQVVVDGAATINSDVEVAGLTINAAKSLTVNAAKQLTISGTATNNGTITIQSDANGTGTIVGNVSGAATVNQHLSSYRTWYLSSPVSNVTPANMNRYKFYEEATNTWPTTAPAQTTGAGFLAVPTDNAVTSTSFSGTLNNGAIAIPLTYSVANTLKRGFNLVGNPYPSYLDWTAVYAANTNNLSTSTLWYRTKAGAYTFWTVNGESGEGSPAAATKEIAPMQAFWVRTAANGSLNLSNTLRSHAPAGGSLLKAPAANSNTLIRFEVSNGTNTDETVLYFNANASNEFDVYDSPKMSNEDADIAEIYTRAGNERLVMNGMPAIQKDAEIALGFEAGNATSFSLRANEVRNLASDVKVILKDNVTQTETDLTDGTGVYAFGNLATSGDRFSIIFRTTGAVTGVETPASGGLTVYNSGREQLTVLYNGAIDARTTVSVYNAVGQRLANQLLTGTTTVVNAKFIPGVYVVKVNNLSRKLTIKY